MSESKFTRPWVVQLRQYNLDEEGKLKFFKNESASFGATNQYGEKVSIPTDVGSFIASLIAPDLDAIKDFVAMGKTIENRAEVVFPGTPSKIEMSADEPFQGHLIRSITYLATYLGSNGKDPILELRADFTDHPVVSFESAS